MNREKYIKDKSYREGYEEGRKEGVEAIINIYTAYLNRLEEDITYLRERLENIKSESEPKIGHWIPRNSFLLQYKCSECGCESEWCNFCPNCGVYMRGDERIKNWQN